MSIPDYLGKYQILSLLGRGSMGRVYKAKDPDIDQLVAIKTIQREFLENAVDTEVLQRFKNEVIASRRLKHARIVSTYEYNEGDEVGPFIVMEYVAGQSLADLIKAKVRLSVSDAFDYMQQILSALAYAHDNNVVHRDIKPANIMINEAKQIQIMDFGIAKLESSDLTMAGTILGTPSYMSPEQCMGQNVDARSDLFSAAIIFYQMLTGSKPFAADSQMATLHQIVNTPAIEPSELVATCTLEIDQLMAKALAKSPDKRYQTAQAFADKLEELKEGALRAERDQVGNDVTVIYAQAGQVSKSKYMPYKTLKYILLLAGLMGAGWGIYSAMLAPLPANKVRPSAEPLPETALLKAQLRLFFKQYPCSSFEVIPVKERQFKLTGFVPSGTLGLLQQALSGVVDGEIIMNLKQVNAGNCDVIKAIWPYHQKGQALHFTLGKNGHSFKKGDHLTLDVVLPDFAVYLNIDYIQADGTVVHLLDNRYIDPEKVGNILKLGNNKEWAVTEPFGVDMLIATVSKNAIFSFSREPFENKVSYLKTWQGITQQEVMVDFLHIQTAE